jgi:hypothetical protein
MTTADVNTASPFNSLTPVCSKQLQAWGREQLLTLCVASHDEAVMHVMRHSQVYVKGLQSDLTNPIGVTSAAHRRHQQQQHQALSD